MEKKVGAAVDGGKLITTLIITVSTAVVFLALGYWAGSIQGKEDAATDATISTTATASSTTSASPSATASATSTADWKTYTNEEYGFSFKYPEDWIIDKDDFSSGGNYISLKKGTEISFQVNATSTGKELGYGVEWTSDYYKGQINSLGKIEISSHKETNGLEENPKVGAATIFALTYGGNSYDVVDTFEFSQRTKSVEQYELILSTFQFTSK